MVGLKGCGGLVMWTTVWANIGSGWELRPNGWDLQCVPDLGASSVPPRVNRHRNQGTLMYLLAVAQYHVAVKLSLADYVVQQQPAAAACSAVGSIAGCQLYVSSAV